MSKQKVVAVVGNLGSPSKTVALVNRIVRSIASHVEVDVHVVQVAQLARGLGPALSRKEAPPDVEAALRLVENASVLVAASPVYRATYTGLFKHLWDLVPQDSLVDVPVVLAATGGSDRHALVIEHSFRPLFAFFRASPIPTGVYASDRDFEDGDVASGDVLKRIELAGWQAARALRARAQTPIPVQIPAAVRAV